MNENEFLVNIGANIDRIRKKSGLTIQELAEAVGMEKQNLWPILKGKNNVTAKTLFKLANALDVDVKEFFK